MDRALIKSVTIDWKAAEQYFTVVLFVFGRFINFGLGTFKSKSLMLYKCNKMIVTRIIGLSDDNQDCAYAC